MAKPSQLVLLTGMVYQPATVPVSQVCWLEFSLKKSLTPPLPNSRLLAWLAVHGLSLGASWKLTRIARVRCPPRVLGRSARVVVPLVVLLVVVLPSASWTRPLSSSLRAMSPWMPAAALPRSSSQPWARTLVPLCHCCRALAKCSSKRSPKGVFSRWRSLWLPSA